MLPTIGRIVAYRLNKDNAKLINERRNDFNEASKDILTEKLTGFVAHVGNSVSAEDVYPLIITRVWPNGLINGQVLLDGNDSLWVTSITEGDEVGTFSWPVRS